MTEAVSGGVTRDALVSPRLLVVAADCRPHLAAPYVPPPWRLSVFGEQRSTGQLVLGLLLEEFDGLDAEEYVPWAQFRGSALAMSEPQRPSIEIRYHCGRKLLWAGTRELESAKESTRGRRGCSNDCLSLSRVNEDRGLTAFLDIIRQRLEPPGRGIAEVAELDALVEGALRLDSSADSSLRAPAQRSLRPQW